MLGRFMFEPCHMDEVEFHAPPRESKSKRWLSFHPFSGVWFWMILLILFDVVWCCLILICVWYCLVLFVFLLVILLILRILLASLPLFALLRRNFGGQTGVVWSKRRRNSSETHWQRPEWCSHTRVEAWPAWFFLIFIFPNWIGTIGLVS